eukprot:6452220-Pyramimonas_sp.AAC.1
MIGEVVTRLAKSYMIVARNVILSHVTLDLKNGIHLRVRSPDEHSSVHTVKRKVFGSGQRSELHDVLAITKADR